MEIIHLLIGYQQKSNKGRNPKLGKGFNEAYRLNPYNPMSYVTLLFLTIYSIFVQGFVGTFDELKTYNPFKWH